MIATLLENIEPSKNKITKKKQCCRCILDINGCNIEIKEFLPYWVLPLDTLKSLVFVGILGWRYTSLGLLYLVVYNINVLVQRHLFSYKYPIL